jgi:hypothetical protein
MTSTEALLSYLQRYESLVAEFNSELVQAYKISVPAIKASKSGLIPRSGTFQSDEKLWNYSFHGMGCYVECGSLVIDFDYAFRTFQYLGFEVRKLRLFLQSSLPPNSPLLKNEDFDLAFSELLRDGSIVPKPSGDINTYEYMTRTELI